ncbi:MAG: GNAT family N-acetyltransferase [Bacteroidales bacterium]|nr:GNAT family N-acetyltransferase [Bacteroidales bacterium]
MMNLPDIYFLPEWGKANQMIDKGEVCIFEYKNYLGHVYYQFIKRQVPDDLGHVTYYDIITPYGFSGPIVLAYANSNKKVLITKFDKAFNEYCLHEHIIAEYVRFSPWLRNHLDFRTIYTLKYNKYTLYTDLTVRDFFMEEYCSKIRTKIRKAEKIGVQLEYDFSGSSLREFHRLYQSTFEKNAMSEYYLFNLDFLIRTFKSLDNRQFLINALFEDEYISSGIFMEFGDYLHFHLVANNYQHYPKNANSLIMNEAAKWGQKNGKKQLHIGGAFTNELFAYKKQFTRNGKCDFHIGQKIRDEEIYNKLVDLRIKRGETINSNYFPLYRG